MIVHAETYRDTIKGRFWYCTGCGAKWPCLAKNQEIVERARDL